MIKPTKKHPFGDLVVLVYIYIYMVPPPPHVPPLLWDSHYKLGGKNMFSCFGVRCAGGVPYIYFLNSSFGFDFLLEVLKVLKLLGTKN